MSNINFVIIDDSPSILETIADVIGKLCRHNSKECKIDKFKSVSDYLDNTNMDYNIAVIDWNLPDGKGKEIAQNLNGSCKYKIIFTGMDDDSGEISEFCLLNNVTYIPKGSKVKVNRKDIDIVSYLDSLIQRY